MAKIRRAARATLIAAVAALVAVLAPAPPAAATTLSPAGHVDHLTQSAWGWLSVAGWAYDRGKPSASSTVDIVADGTVIAHVLANRSRPDVNSAYHITGYHGFSWGTRRTLAHVVRVYARPLVSGEPSVLLLSKYLNGYLPPPALSAGARIIAKAKTYVGTVPYAYGGTSPSTGFDCSGYTQYVYRVTHVASLPRTAEQQRHAVRGIYRSQARAGDLVFYMSSNGTAYHEAIYAGNGMQYAAATPQDGIRYQTVWSSNVRYGTDWH